MTRIDKFLHLWQNIYQYHTVNTQTAKSMKDEVIIVMQIISGIIVPLISVAVTVTLTAYFASLQTKKSKLTELKYQYLSKSLDELNCIEIKMLECVRLMASCLVKQNPNDRHADANQIIKELSAVNMHIYSFTTNQAPLNNAIGIDLT